VAKASVAYLTTMRGQEEFSATVCYDGCAAFIIYNNTHAPVRQASSIAHELAHVVLRHPPLPLIKADGTRAFEKEYEDEAGWLGPALLISEEAALHIAEQGWSATEAGRIYGVSAALVTMRVQVTGAKTRLARRKVA
jgi:Zn-dependent peptidase ImmA (M78 family)